MMLSTSKRACRILPAIKNSNIPFARYKNLFYKTSCKNISAKLDDEIESKFERAEIKPRQHPGRVNRASLEIPPNFVQALQRIVGDYPMKRIQADAVKLNQYIAARHPPPEYMQLKNRVSTIVEKVNERLPKEKMSSLDEDEKNIYERKREKVISKLVAERTYAWKPINYTHYESVVYAIGRGIYELAVLQSIMFEIKSRDPYFKPRSFFDFGSGIGTGMWAASKVWKNMIYEFFNVDSSRYMNDLSDLLLRNGIENQDAILRNVYYRQYLPALDTKYDVVISAYTLFEIGRSQDRKVALLKLWQKCNGYLIIVEEGSRRGSELVNEARDYLLKKDQHGLKGHTFAPCPHDLQCPRLNNKDDTTPCNFGIRLPSVSVGSLARKPLLANYSYVVLKKGEVTDKTRDWPRLVRPTIVRSKHAHCKMCTKNGELKHAIFTKSKHGNFEYKISRVSTYGDRLPFTLTEHEHVDNGEEVRSQTDGNFDARFEMQQEMQDGTDIDYESDDTEEILQEIQEKGNLDNGNVQAENSPKSP